MFLEQKGEHEIDLVWFGESSGCVVGTTIATWLGQNVTLA